MKAELAPKYSQKVGDNYVLWFERSNSYVVLSSTAYLLLIAYFESSNRTSYLKHLQEKFNITRTEGTSYYLDVSNFLDEVNSEIQALDTNALLQEIPTSHISNLYDFGGSHILINYGSNRLLQLIHPYIQHMLNKVNSDVKATYDIFDAKKPNQNKIIRKCIEIQKRMGFKRPLSAKMPKLYGGSTWWSISRDCASYVVGFTKKNKYFLNRFKFTLCSEEFYFQTIIINSKFVDKVVNKNLRFIDWVARNGNNPAILDETDYKKVMSSDAFFARKFDYPYSKLF